MLSTHILTPRVNTQTPRGSGEDRPKWEALGTSALVVVLDESHGLVKATADGHVGDEPVVVQFDDHVSIQSCL